MLWSLRCPNGQLGTVGRARILRTSDINDDGLPEVVVGTAAWWVLCLDGSGRELWRYECYAHSALDLVVADLDGDGRKEVVQSNEYYYIHMTSHDGRGLAERYVGPKASRVFPLVVPEGRGEVICGASDARVRLFKLERGEGPFPFRLEERWSVPLGGEVTGLVLRGEGGLLAGSEGYRLTSLDLEGNLLWEVELGEPVRWIWPEEVTLAVGDETVFLMGEGEVISSWEVGGTLTSALRLGGGVLLGTGDGRALWAELGV